MIGLNFPKGLRIAVGGVLFSKDGIAEMLSDWNIATALVARLFGVLDTLFTAIAIPLMIAIYTILILFGVLMWILLFPFVLGMRSRRVTK